MNQQARLITQCLQNDFVKLPGRHQLLPNQLYVGGLGRSGTAAACYLIRQGMGASQAMREVRLVRSQRAIESEPQERFIESWAADGR